MIFYVVKCRLVGDASIARRDAAAEALRVVERRLRQSWPVAGITRGLLVIDETAFRQDAERESMAA